MTPCVGRRPVGGATISPMEACRANRRWPSTLPQGARGYADMGRGQLPIASQDKVNDSWFHICSREGDSQSTVAKQVRRLYNRRHHKFTNFWPLTLPQVQGETTPNHPDQLSIARTRLLKMWFSWRSRHSINGVIWSLTAHDYRPRYRGDDFWWPAHHRAWGDDSWLPTLGKFRCSAIAQFLPVCSKLVVLNNGTYCTRTPTVCNLINSQWPNQRAGSYTDIRIQRLTNPKYDIHW